MTIQPLRERLLVLPDVAQTHTASGLELVQRWNPDTTGTVVATGPGTACACGRLSACPVDVGDHIVFSYEAGQDITLDETRYLMLRFEDVLGVLEERAHGGRSRTTVARDDHAEPTVAHV